MSDKTLKINTSGTNSLPNLSNCRYAQLSFHFPERNFVPHTKRSYWKSPSREIDTISRAIQLG